MWISKSAALIRGWCLFEARPALVGGYTVFAYFNSNTLYSVHLFYTDGLFQSICFRMFCFKHAITFENTHVLTYFNITFKFCKYFTVINS